MDDLLNAIRTTPIIDNHAHPLLTPSAQAKYPLLAITTEAHGDAMKATPSTLAHIRAVNQLSEVLKCPPTWNDVVHAVDVEKSKSIDGWAKRCLEGIEIILVDDGLDGKEEVFDYAWHDRLTRSKCKRIVRVEKVAEEIIDGLLKKSPPLPDIFPVLMESFEEKILEAIADSEVVGFKSVICYRTGLNIPPRFSKTVVKAQFEEHIAQLWTTGAKSFKRIDGQPLNAYLVHKTAMLIRDDTSKLKKPFQFHTGLGDNDITLTTSSPSQLQEFIRTYPTVPIVLLHASYPWTKEAGYLASVYENVYADIGEVFPFLSKDGQETVVREILELCPTEKILWSTDGHWFPETYLLAIIQVREALEAVLSEYVRKKVLTVSQAVKAVEDILFTTSNVLYGLGLTLKPFPGQLPSSQSDIGVLSSFLEENPSTKFLRLQYLDYTSTLRLRVIPVQRALSLLEGTNHLSVGMTKACLGLLQNDHFIPQVIATGEYNLHAMFSSLRPGPLDGYASIQGEFREHDGSEVETCPRTTLRCQVQTAKSHDLEFLIGFEIEIVFLTRGPDTHKYAVLPRSVGHAWSSARVLHDQEMLKMMGEISDTLSAAGIYLEQWHVESATGQYEFVLPPLPPVDAVDTLVHAREIITAIASRNSLRATLFPKPFPDQPGTASHVHISIPSPNGEEPSVYEAFYAGILEHLPGIIAFTYSSIASYDRIVDGCWAGGRWVAWGTQNRETALRKIAGSHWEFKVLDGLANPYFAMAAIIAAGTEGVLHHTKLELGDCLVDPGTLSGEERESINVRVMLPEDFKAATQALERDSILKRRIGERVVERYLQVKEEEMKLLGGMREEEKREWIIERY